MQTRAHYPRRLEIREEVIQADTPLWGINKPLCTVYMPSGQMDRWNGPPEGVVQNKEWGAEQPAKEGLP